MRSPTFIFAAALLLSSSTFAQSAINPTAVNANSRPVLKDVYILQRDDGSFAKRQLGSRIFESIIDILRNARINAEIRQNYQLDSVFNGASVKVASNVTAADLEALPGIRKAWPVRMFELPKGLSAEDAIDARAGPIEASRLARETGNTLASRMIRSRAPASAGVVSTFGPHTMTGVNVTHSRGLLGKGIKIGVLDSGVDYTNPILGGCFGEGCHVSFGYDLVGDAYDGNNTPVPGGEKGPFTDCNEHGTHVTGTISALPNQFGFTGVAYEAEIGHYRIFGCEGSVSEDIIFAALMRGIQDKCDILTLSLGGTGNWVANSPSEILIDSVATQGVVVTVAAGNSGSEGTFFAQEPAGTVEQISVASTDNLESTAYAATIVNNGTIPVLSVLPLAVNGTLKVYFTSSDSSLNNDGCQPLPESTPNLAEFVTVVQRGSCAFTAKVANVAARGGKTVLIYNSATGGTLPYLTDPTGIQVGGLKRADGLRLLALWTANKDTSMTFPAGPSIPGLIDTQSGGLISAFSIYGPTADMFGQPTLSAPGGNILSTFPLALGGLGIISGTSMATPFMAGAAAVLMSARRDENLTPLEIRSLLTTTAKLTPSTLTNTSGLTSVIHQGGGLLQLAKAIDTYTFLSPNELLLNDTRSAQYDQVITITNRNKVAVTYTFGSIAAEALAVYAAAGDNLIDPTPEVVAAVAAVSFPVKSARVESGRSYRLRVRFTPPRVTPEVRARFPIFSGWVKIDSSIDSLTIPYFGLAASVFDMPVMDLSDAIYGEGQAYPFLFNNATSSVQVGPANYTLPDGPTLFSRLAGATRSFNIDLVDARIKFIPTAQNIYESPAAGNSSTNATIARRDPFFFDHLIPIIAGKIDDVADKIKEKIAKHRDGRQNAPGGARRLYSATPTIGSIVKLTNANRDNAVDGGATGYSDLELAFDGSFDMPGNKTQKGFVNNSTTYRFLIRALKNSGDAALESNYESWLSSPFAFPSAQ